MQTAAEQTAQLIAALKLARVYVARVAATQPFENNRMGRKLQAVKDLKAIDAALAQFAQPVAA